MPSTSILERTIVAFTSAACGVSAAVQPMKLCAVELPMAAADATAPTDAAAESAFTWASIRLSLVAESTVLPAVATALSVIVA